MTARAVPWNYQRLISPLSQCWQRNILAFDTATPIASAASFITGTRHIGHCHLDLGQGPGRSTAGGGHGELLAPMVKDLMQHDNLAFAELDAIIVTRGPGGFSGVRVGLAMARGLALAAECRIETLLNTQAVMLTAHYSGICRLEDRANAAIVILNVGRSMVALQRFTMPSTAKDPAAKDPAILDPAILPAAMPEQPLCVAADAITPLLDGALLDGALLDELGQPYRGPLRRLGSGVAPAIMDMLETNRPIICNPDAAWFGMAYALGARGAAIATPFYARPPDAKVSQMPPNSRVD